MTKFIQPKIILSCVCILLATTSGVHGQCSTPPMNQVVCDGNQSILMTCNSPTRVSWSVFPTTEELFSKPITNYSDTVTPAYASLYSVTLTNLNIKIGQSFATPNISTSGIYIAQYSPTGPNNKIGAKLVVISPTCNCSAINSTNQTLTCSITYADGAYNPIYANFKWTADGVLFAQSTISTRARVNNAFTSTYTITTSLYDTRTFQCNVTFTNPMSVSLAYIATNAPAFYSICKPNCDNNLTSLYDECVVKAELYTRCANCSSANLVCGVVVTLRNDSRWLIYDPQCNDNKCEMVVVDATFMSSEWMLLAERKVITSSVRDYVLAGNNDFNGLNVTDCSDSCKRMMNLP